MSEKDKIGYSVGFVILILVGLWAIADPSAMEESSAVGRFAFWKQLIADYWGRNLGMAMVVLGALALFGVQEDQ